MRICSCESIAVWVVVSAAVFSITAQVKDVRDRGEDFFNCRVSNTTSLGDIWLSIGGVGHIWDEAPIRLDKMEEQERRWISNARIFPEIALRAGVFHFGSVIIESRPLSWAFKPGWVSGEFKLTLPDNDRLRFSGTGLSVRYVHSFTEGPPTIGGNRGFMPDGYVLEGGAFEGRLIHELDFIARERRVPLRWVTNLGLRVPMEREMAGYYQYLVDAGLMYSAHDFDFYLTYSLEAFNNLFEPKVFEMGDKRWLVYFSENLSYLTVGGNIRYPNGLMLSVSLPILLSVNQGKSISLKNLEDLNRGQKTADEVQYGISDLFDPWFVKWKVNAFITVPMRHRRSSTEMLRSYMLLKNKREPVRIDFDEKLERMIGEEDEF